MECLRWIIIYFVAFVLGCYLVNLSFMPQDSQLTWNSFQTMRDKLDIRKAMSYPSSNPTYIRIMESKSYDEALATAAIDKKVLLAFADLAFRPMAINFYKACVEAFNIENYVFVSISSDLCKQFSNHKINCFVYKEDSDNTPSNFGTASFVRKMDIRTDMVLKALEYGYSVYNMDVDMFCYKHPLKHIVCEEQNCDLIALKDGKSHNSGFLYINPTNGSRKVYQDMVQMQNT